MTDVIIKDTTDMPDKLDRLSQIQQEYLNYLQSNKLSAAVYLKNGIKLTGHIEGFNTQGIFLKQDSLQMIYFHAVSTITQKGVERA